MSPDVATAPSIVSSNFDHLQDVSMFDLFRTEVEDNALRMETGLVEVERGGDELPQVWRSLMRAAHSVKGAARMVNISAGVQVAHAMESCFVAGQQGKIPATRPLVDLMLQGKDLLVNIARTPEAQLKSWSSGEHAEIVKAYASACETFLLSPPPIPDEPEPDNEEAAGVAEEELSFGEGGLTAEAALTSEAEPIADDIDLQDHSADPEAEIEIASLSQRASEPERDSTPSPQPSPVPPRAPVPPVTAIAPSRPGHMRAAQSVPAAVSAPRSPSSPSPSSAKGAPAARPVTHISGAVSSGGNPGSGPGQGSSDPGRMLRVTADHLDRLLGLSGESLVNARRLHALADGMRRLKRMQRQVIQLIDRAKSDSKDERLGQILQEAHGKATESQHYLVARLGEMDRYDREAVDLSHRLYRRAQACRMRPFADGIQHFPRMVRDLASTLGKEARLEMAGVAVEVDRDILDQLEAPLTHMIRNSLDHGIEFPDERARAGKEPVGVLRLEARHAAGKLIVSFSDDGRGMDIEHIRSAVLERGLATAATAERLSQPELLNFLFLPGFTLRDEVSEFSGRGVGLDVVQHMLKQLRGEVRVTSEPGQGARFDLKLPLALSVVRTLVVEVAEEPYAFPLSRIRRTLRLEHDKIVFVEGRPCFSWERRSVAILGSWELLGKERPQHPASHLLQVVIFEHDDSTYALAVDRFIGDRELVVQPLHPLLGKVPNIQAAAVLDDGTPVLILDVEDMARSLARISDSGRWSLQQQSAAGMASQAAVVKHRRILVVDDSLTVRELERKVLIGAGYEVETAVDGSEGWNLVRTKPFDMILTDVDMPRMDGIELTGLIKTNARLNQLPVMIVSYKDSPADRKRGLDAGADYYLAKSGFEDAMLLKAVVDLIGPAVPADGEGVAV